MLRLRHRLGALLYDWPRFLAAMAGRDRWTRFRNRNERLSFDEATGGARCEWQFTSDLHIGNVYPATARWLMRRAIHKWPIEFANERRRTGEPRVSFIIGHRGESRLPHLLATVATIAAQDVAVECIVVEQSVQAIAKSRLPAWVRYLHTPIDSDDLPYNRSWAFNAGVRAARTNLLVLHDNDFLVPGAYASQLLERHAEGWEFIDTKRFMFYLSHEDSERLFRSHRLSRDVTPERVMQNSIAGGSIAADRSAYLEIGGFDEGFTGWGGEDNEFLERASTRRLWAYGYLPFIHLWHASQTEKTVGSAGGGFQRMEQLARVPPEERIARLQAPGRTHGPIG
jgi:hypothetical protein